MEEILNEVKSYDIIQLRQKLTENGVDVGPMGPSSMSLFQRCLAKKLFKLEGGKLEEDSEETNANIPDIPVNKRSEPTAESTDKLPDVFYAVCLPENVDPQIKKEVNQLVFSDKNLALKTAKKVKNARFKAFKLESDAQEFSKLTAESAFNSPRKPDNTREDPKDKEKEKQMPSESSLYKSPRPQEIIVIRKAIEGGNVEFFRKCVWENPRYLVGSGDTPVIYQEGSRYTAMHVAAKENKPEVCQVILDTIENPDFIQQLYSQSEHTEETQNSRINFLVDFYLNLPDKGNCESPLHMACKFGHDKVVEKLIAHPKTDRKLKNKWGDSPRDVICSRCQGASATLKQRIEMLLEGQSYVPLLRSDDNSTVPVIGQPWSPDKNSPLQKVDKTWSPKDPSMSVKAYAGPMSPSNARTFHKRWTTPPSKSPDQAKKYFDIKRSDSEKGLERIGRQLAHEMKIPWLEYWEFLNAYVDLSCDTGLELLEKYFEKMIWLEFVKTFKDKYVVVVEGMNFSTPVKQERLEKNVEKSTSKESVSERNDKLKEGTACDIFQELELVESEKKKDEVVSPMTSLAQSFAQIKLLDESWSDKATVCSTEKSVIDDASDRDLKAKVNLNNNVTAVLNNSTSIQVNDCLSDNSNGCDKSNNTKEKDDKVEKESFNSHSETSVNEEICNLESSKVPTPEIGDTGDTKIQKSSSREENIQVSDETDVESHVNNEKDKLPLTENNDSKQPFLSAMEYGKGLSEDCDIHLSKIIDTRNTHCFSEETKNTVIPVSPSDGCCKTDDEKILDTDNSAFLKKGDLLKQRSCSSESNDSFKTTTEEVEDADGAETSVKGEKCNLENSKVPTPETGDTGDTKIQKSSSREEKLKVLDKTDDESHVNNEKDKLPLTENNDSKQPFLSAVEYGKGLSEDCDIHLSKIIDTRNTHCSSEETKNTVIPVSPSDGCCKTDDEKILDTDNSAFLKKGDLLKQRSCSSESNDSFKTTTEEVEDADGAAFHDLDEPVKHVCINVSNTSVVNKLKECLQKQKNKAEDESCLVKFVARLKSLSSNTGFKIDIVSLPGDGVITCSELLVLEDIDVSSCEGDLGSTAEGDIVEIGTGNRSDSSIEDVVYAHLSRSVTLPKVAYLHGPQPTREDLDVSRAVGDTVIVPDLYPNVFHWKIRLSRFLKDTSYRWQSPAKVRSKQLQGSPQPLPRRRSSPVIQYGSPLGLQSQSRITALSDIRTRLFPTIAE